MRSPFRSFTHWITGTVLSLLVIITILLGYNFLSAEYAKFEALEQEQSVLHKVKNDLEGVRDKFAKELPARIPQPGTPLNLLAERIKVLESEINTKQATRQKLWDDHPIERHLPISNPFREISTARYRDRIPATRCRQCAQPSQLRRRATGSRTADQVVSDRQQQAWRADLPKQESAMGTVQPGTA